MGVGEEKLQFLSIGYEEMSLRSALELLPVNSAVYGFLVIELGAGRRGQRWQRKMLAMLLLHEQLAGETGVP